MISEGKNSLFEKNKIILFAIILLHLLLVMTDIFLYGIAQVGDTPRYISVANEFFSLSLANLNYMAHINTAPGYPLFLAVIKIFTFHNVYLVALVQSVIYILAVFYFLNTLFKKRIVTELYYLLAFIILLISPELFQANSKTITESLCASLLLFSFGALLSDMENKDRVIFISSIVLLVLVRYEYLPVFLLVIIALLVRKLWPLAILTVVLLLTFLSLNALRNEYLFDEYNPFGYGAGTVMYGGNNENGDASWHTEAHIYGFRGVHYLSPENTKIFSESNNLNTRKRFVYQDSLFKAMAFKAWEEDPVYQLKKIPLKFAKLWSLPGDIDLYTPVIDGEFKSGLYLSVLFDDYYWPWYGKYKHAVYLGIYWMITILSLVGFYLKIKDKGFDVKDIFILFVIGGISFLYSVPFYGIGRFHIPLYPLILLYAPYTIMKIDEKFLGEKISKILLK